MLRDLKIVQVEEATSVIGYEEKHGERVAPKKKQKIKCHC